MSSFPIRFGPVVTWATLTLAATVVLQARAVASANYWFDAPSYNYQVGDFPSGGAPQVAGIADFDGDGFNDVVTVSQGSGRVTVLLGGPDGILAGRRDTDHTPVDVHPTLLTIADFNEDGHPDLVVSGFDGTRVLLGNGDGTFTRSPQTAVTQPASAIATGDFDRDGHTDLVLLWGWLLVAHGRGDGTFAALDTNGTSPATYPFWCAVGDVNGDDWPDVIVSTQLAAGHQPKYSACLVNDHQGGFTASSLSLWGPVAIGDVTRDGHADVVAAGANYVYVLAGNGDGSFAARALQNLDLLSSVWLTDVEIADVDGYGAPELVASDEYGAFWVLSGWNGTSFVLARYGVPWRPLGVTVGDVDGDAVPDVVITDGQLSTVSVTPGHGDGTFGGGKLSLIPGYPSDVPVALAAGDLNGDGKVDLAAALHLHLVTLVGRGDGTFTMGDTLAASVAENQFGGQVAIADVNLDHVLDVLFARQHLFDAMQNDNQLLVFLGRFGGGFEPAIASPTAVGPISIAVHDLDGDGKPDVVVSSVGAYSSANYSITIMHGNGNGTFMTTQALSVTRATPPVAIGDFNDDGLPDFVAPSLYIPSSGDTGEPLQVFLAVAPGEYGPPTTVPTRGEVRSVAVTDFDRDGHLDLLWGEYRHPSFGYAEFGCVHVAYGSGNGTFRVDADCYGALGSADRIDVVDMNGDRVPDVVVNALSQVVVWLGTPTGTLGTRRSFSPSGWARAIADVDDQGMPDIVSGGFYNSPRSPIVSMLSRFPDATTPTILALFTARPVASGIEIEVEFQTEAPETMLIERSPAEVGPWMPVSGTRRVEGALTTLVDTEVVSGATYFYRIRTQELDGTSRVFGPISTTAVARTGTFALRAVSPNPVGSRVHVGFTLGVAGRVRLSVVDVQGRQVAELARGALPPGPHVVDWNLDASSRRSRPGLYWIRLEAPEGVLTTRFALLR